MIAEPVVLAELVSPSSEADDARRKWFSYRDIPSLKRHVVLSQAERVAQLHGRSGDLSREGFVTAGAIEFDERPVRLEVEAINAGTEITA